MSKKQVSVLSIVLYVLAGIVAMYTVWATVNVHEYIQGVMAQQQITFKGNEYNIINSYVSSAGQYGIYAIILAVLGWILQKLSPAVNTPAPLVVEQEIPVQNEAEIECAETTLDMPTAEENVSEEAETVQQ